MTVTKNPMREDNGFKLGLFAYSYEGGNAITTVPERWSCQWPDIRKMIQLADRSGLDFLLPPARWRGIPGAVNNRLWSFELLRSPPQRRRLPTGSPCSRPSIHRSSTRSSRQRR